MGLSWGTGQAGRELLLSGSLSWEKQVGIRAHLPVGSGLCVSSHLELSGLFALSGTGLKRGSGAIVFM